MYRPLPYNVTIKQSGIHGLGLFASHDISKDLIIGLTHIRDERFEDEYIRTPLGGFFNHEPNSPNCKIFTSGNFLYLVAIKNISMGEEITAKYTLYDPC